MLHEKFCGQEENAHSIFFFHQLSVKNEILSITHSILWSCAICTYNRYHNLLSWTYLFHWNPVHGHHIHLHSFSSLSLRLFGKLGTRWRCGKRFFPLGRLVCGHQTCWIEVSGWKTESTPWCHHIRRIQTVGCRDLASLEGVVHGVWMKVEILWREAANFWKVVSNRQFKEGNNKGCKLIWIDLLWIFFWQRPFRTSQRSRSEHWRKLISYRSYLLIDQTRTQLQWLCAAVALHCRKVLLYNQPAIISLLQHIYQTRRSAWSENKIYYLLIKIHIWYNL